MVVNLPIGVSNKGTGNRWILDGAWIQCRYGDLGGLLSINVPCGQELYDDPKF